MSTSLDAEVRSALIARKGEWQSIAQGSGVSYSWLSKFVNERIGNPGYAKLRDLHEYLNSKKKTRAAA